MDTVGFIGLGIMGGPMAKNLLAATGSLLVHDISRAAVADLAACGATPADLQEMAARCNIIFLSLPGGPVVHSVLFGEGGLAAQFGAGTIICDMSTTELTEARSFARLLGAMGIDFMDAPVSGGQSGAINGKLVIMAGGEQRCFRAVRAYLEAMGSVVSHVGGQGSGCAVKLINQILVHVTMAGICEAYALAEKLGLDLAVVHKAVNRGSACSAMLNSRTPKILNRDFSPGAKISIVHKDIRNVLAAGREADMPLPLTGMVFDLLQAAKASRFENDDITRLLTVYERFGNIHPEIE
jgi:2-hydroxy-3-oxopropionate reductase